MQVQDDILAAAHHYAGLGFSTIPVDKNKQPCVKWAPYQQRIASTGELDRMFSLQAVAGIALVCGMVSGGLEVIDIDDKNDLDGRLFSRLWDRIEQYSPALAAKLLASLTRSQGHHIYYRCREVGNNRKLASRPTNVAEQLLNPDQLVKVLVETRGNKGYVIAPPTAGYFFLQQSLDTIPLISPDERDALLNFGRSFDQVPEKEIAPRLSGHRPKSSDDPLTDYDDRGDVISLLMAHGWIIAGEDSERTFLKRPGDTQSISSSNYHYRLRRFKVFSTSTLFEAEQPYTPSAVFAILECQGDFKEAARRLLKMGYGKARLVKYRPESGRQKKNRG
ncbi:bifunctional DNA primase/polymerase [Chitinophaga sp. S165]|uniref:bifunctional DNA primase/polymerase n=1 Tax=Chitinophaga sp. S165 TaxID=2135462 RepID=UPI000D7161B3|nr:bifunctional DNA primase/polymerase [Chitinophaga sp. S165]PWV47144.1 bifunctional DNA primase/polymerase-like protein [Chitinophaga sp. S165]